MGQAVTVAPASGYLFPVPWEGGGEFFLDVWNSTVLGALEMPPLKFRGVL